MFIYIALIITGFACIFNVGKFLPMLKSYVNNKPYGIFPWMCRPILSNSNQIWLIIHLVIALTLVLMVMLYLIQRNKKILPFFKYVHWPFTFMILGNICNFGQSSVYNAMIMNGIPLLIANLAYWKLGKWMVADYIYFFALTSPVIFEVGIWLKNFGPIFIEIVKML